MKTLNFPHRVAVRAIVVIAASALITSYYNQKAHDDHVVSRRQRLLGM